MEKTSATVVADHAEVEQFLELVSFILGEEEFGVDILKIQEINKMLAITPVPDAPGYVKGVINLRGRIIPIVDLRCRFGFPEREPDKNTRIVVAELGGKIVGLVVDAVMEVMRISSSVFEPPPQFLTGAQSEYITAVGKLDDRLLLLLDLDRVLESAA